MVVEPETRWHEHMTTTHSLRPDHLSARARAGGLATSLATSLTTCLATGLATCLAAPAVMAVPASAVNVSTGSAAEPHSVAPPSAARGKKPKPTGNLIRNASAEKFTGDPDDFTQVQLKAWKIVGDDRFTANAYVPDLDDPDEYGSRLAMNSRGPGGRGEHYFAGAYKTSSAEHGRARQVVDLIPFVSRLKSGARFTLQGWFGGYAGNEDAMGLTLTWTTKQGKKVGRRVELDPVTLEERDLLSPGEPGEEITMLARRRSTGKVPRRARKARIALDSHNGAPGAYADRLVLKLK